MSTGTRHGTDDEQNSPPSSKATLLAQSNLAAIALFDRTILQHEALDASTIWRLVTRHLLEEALGIDYGSL